jgi:pilus assembly protein FimV
VTQQSGNQFDDDLTVGMDNNESFVTDSIDLFEFTGDEESPIARLKTIILSIDWEINDDILQQLDDELVDLADIWAGDKIKQIYIQGLKKIGQYIYKEKANAHPKAITLLITFYHNLEKIVSLDDLMSEEEKKQLLLEDVKKFDQLKSQIGKSDSASGAVGRAATSMPVADTAENDEAEQLKVLKGQVLGIDGGMNDKDLQKLNDEVQRLEGVFSQSKAKCILLQGIGALSSYINKMRSKSNSKAFALLHSFYGVLEKISSSELSAGEEKRLLLAEVEKFNAFKGEIAQTQPEPEVKRDAVTEVPVESLPVDESDGDIQVASDVESRLASVFGEVDKQEVDEIADENIALEGVNVETEADDDSDEESLPYEDGSVAPALAEVEEESSFSVEKLAGDLDESTDTEDSGDVEIEYEAVLQGVDVETEADDDSDEEALLFEDDEIAPALTGSTDEGGFDEDSLTADFGGSDSEDLDNRLDSFFDAEVQTSSDEWSGDQQAEFEQKAEEALASAGLNFFDQDEPAPALSECEELSVAEEAFLDDDEIEVPLFEETEDSPVLDDEEALSFLDEEPAAFDDSEELVDTDRIEFTSPGEVIPGIDSGIIDEKESSLDDVIECNVPGEEDAAETVFAAIEETDGEEVVFEAVNDYVEVDPLPGEEYADSTDAIQSDDEDEVEFFEAKAPEFPSVDESEVVSADEYVTLGNLIESLQGNITAAGLQNLLTEINRLRSSSTSNYTGKIFLQLLSTVCQHPEGTLADSDDVVRLSLMEEVFAGLKMQSAADVSADQVQEHLLICTSQVLLLQQKDISRVQTVLSEEQQETAVIAEGVNSTIDDQQNKQVVSGEPSGSDEQLKSFVQEELADIRKLFLEEITMLRKELVDK